MVAVIHISTFVGFNPRRIGPLDLFLFSALFLIGPVMILATSRVNERRDYWKVVTRYAPKWMRRLIVLTVVYGFFNFGAYFLLTKDLEPVEFEGRKALKGAGKVVRIVDDAEFQKYQRWRMRGMTGHALMFYVIAATVLRSRLNDPSDPLFKETRFKFLREN